MTDSLRWLVRRPTDHGASSTNAGKSQETSHGPPHRPASRDVKERLGYTAGGQTTHSAESTLFHRGGECPWKRRPTPGCGRPPLQSPDGDRRGQVCRCTVLVRDASEEPELYHSAVTAAGRARFDSKSLRATGQKRTPSSLLKRVRRSSAIGRRSSSSLRNAGWVRIGSSSGSRSNHE